MTRDDGAEEAWAASFLSGVHHDVAQALSAETLVESVADRTLILGRSAQRKEILLVVTGVVRVFLRGRDGRQITARYAGAGEVIGLPVLLAAGIEVDAEALTDLRIVRISGERFRELAVRDASLAWATACYMAEQLGNSSETLGANIFLPVRARVARHLLDLALRDEHGHIVRVGHQYLADAIGSVREVVTRELRHLAHEGHVERDGRATRLRDLAALHRIARGDREPS